MYWRLKECIVLNVVGWSVSMMVEVCFVLGRSVIFCQQESVYLDGISVVDWSVCGFRLENEFIAGVSFLGRCVGIGWSVFVSCDAL